MAEPTSPVLPDRVHSAGQLLSLALLHEQPELETRKAQLLQQQASQKLQLSGLEKQLLQALATSRWATRRNAPYMRSAEPHTTKSCGCNTPQLVTLATHGIT